MLNFLYTAVSWVLLLWHHLFNAIGLPADGGLNWALSIVFLTITARLLLFRVFVKQIKYQRQMAALQPEIKKIQQKYKNDRAEQQRQMMAFQQEHGFNPLAGCLPMVLQWPIFVALFHVLRHLANSVALCQAWNYGQGGAKPDPKLALYTFTNTETCNAAQAKLFGHAPLAAHLREASSELARLGGTRGVLAATVLVLVVVSAGATFMTQRLARQANPVKPEGQAALIAKAMQYLIPVFTLGSGLFFPLGTLLYWFTSNTWTMAQQLYVNKYHPHEDTKKPPVGELGKTLAPKPGAKPGAKPARQTKVVEATVTDETTDETTAEQRPVTPRPGQKPNRPGNRPGGNRSPKKKRR